MVDITMVDIVDLLRTIDCDQLLPEEIAKAAEEIEMLRAENAQLRA
jgi:hypothetical protein